ncbi:MAG: hydrogenase maturation protease [Chloroflexi bacterium]|nr:hydrogenase maturation protease [Chloroflexota bacterium]
MTRAIVIGLGNPILGDDGVGWRVAEEVKKQIAISDQPLAIEVDCFSLGGLSLMERLIGYDRAIIVDAVSTGRQIGAVSVASLDDLPNFSSTHTTAAHDTSLQTALGVGRKTGAHLPRTVTVVGVEAERVYDFGEQLTPAVEAAVPQAAQRVIDLLRRKE